MGPTAPVCGSMDQAYIGPPNPVNTERFADVDEPAEGSMAASPGPKYSFELRPGSQPAASAQTGGPIDQKLENLTNLVGRCPSGVITKRAVKSRNAGLRSQRVVEESIA